MLKKKSLKVGIAVIAIAVIIVVTTLAQNPTSIFSPIVFGPSLYFLGPNESEPNNNFEQANGILLADTDYFGWPNDPDDYYSFENGAIGEVEVVVMGLDVGEGQLFVYHEPVGSPPQLVATSENPPPNMTVLITRADPGKYYAVVHVGPAGVGQRQDSPYTLKVSYQLAPTPTPGSEFTSRPTDGATATPTVKPTKVGDPTATPSKTPTPRS